jgi:hypothetical protein
MRAYGVPQSAIEHAEVRSLLSSGVHFGHDGRVRSCGPPCSPDRALSREDPKDPIGGQCRPVDHRVRSPHLLRGLEAERPSFALFVQGN